MSTLFYMTSNDLPAGPVLEFAYAGDGQGNAAWLTIGDPNLANAIAGNTLRKAAIHLSRSTYYVWKAAYLSPQPVAGEFNVSVDADLSAEEMAAIASQTAALVVNGIPTSATPDQIAEAVNGDAARRLAD